MRGTYRLIFLLAIAAGLLAMPTISVGTSGPPPSEVVDVAVPLEPDRTGQYSGVLEIPDATAVAATLDGRTVEIRWRTDDGSFGPWRTFAASGEHAPDADTSEARLARSDVSEPLWIGDAAAVEIRADGPGAVEFEVVRMPGDRSYTADTDVPAAAEAFAVWPPIVPRYRWDPNNDCAPDRTPRVASAAERIYVHHTVVFPHYDADEADDVLRAICLGHVNKRGFSDLGYNFVIDQYGRIYQGRDGGILQPVVGAHASGFNTGSIGIAIIGDFDAHRVPAAAISALDQLVAWLSHLHGIEPYEVSDHISTGGETTRFAEGDVVALPTIVGHRDTGLGTACPGDRLYEYVRGGHAIAPRVRNILEAEYGWASTDREPPPPGSAKRVAPAAGADGSPAGDGSVASAVGGLVGELTEVVRSPDSASTVATLVRGASVASQLVDRDGAPAGADR